ncbi:hypothetical protein [uncultured Streptococcus sp.]|uniref:hypothetical protein n=1 Tax=uncultured Streptococcus sp. TaxID=83427 RepID=UPI0025951C8D|nr:hypothetical protein [uncultured Streptococcus sp.]
MNVKQTILDEHKTLERVKGLRDELKHVVAVAKIGDILGEINFNEAEKGMIDGFLLLSEVLEDVLNGAEPEEAFENKLKELGMKPDEDKD